MTLFRVMAEQLLDELLGLLVVDELRKFELTLHDLFVDIVWTLRRITKGQHPAQKLIKTNPKRPKIHKVVVALAEDDIRCHIMRCSYNGEGLAHLVVLSADDLRGREVDELHVSFGVDHEVLGLDVTAHDLVVVEVLQYLDDACTVELAVLCGE